MLARLSRKLKETRKTGPCAVCRQGGLRGRHVRSGYDTRIKNTEGRNMMEQVSRGDRRNQAKNLSSDTKIMWVKVLTNKEFALCMSGYVWFVIYDLHIRKTIECRRGKS